MSVEVNIVGGGIIGLTIAATLVERGVRVRIISAPSPGEASSAAAGMLASSVERSARASHDFAVAARDRYPDYIDAVFEKTGIRVPLNRDGILQAAMSEEGIKGLKKTAPSTAQWLDAQEISSIEPALSHALGGLLNPGDGSVDNIALLHALRTLTEQDRRVELIQHSAGKVDGGTVHCADGSLYHAGVTVVATGAWTSQLTTVDITPVRGQMIAFTGSPLRHVVYGPRGYIVPRDSHTIAGSTMERAGFDATTTDEGLGKVRSAAEEICPLLATMPVAGTWAGLRPVTPDGLPVIGRDPKNEQLVYACGHGRNGILLAPLTSDVVADIITGKDPSYDLSPFRPDRFQ